MPIDAALAEIQESLWDPDAGLYRLAAGAAPGLDLDALVLHPVRDSALFAFADLTRGEVERAQRTLDAVLDHQYPTGPEPWAGTFRVTAEEPAPPADAVAFVDYDPNWRQFVGLTLALTVIAHGDLLGEERTARMEQAVAAAVAGEPDDRIADWYTNPTLMAAWLEAWAGTRAGDDSQVARGQARAERLLERFRRFGDVDEYNSPTYDGVDLLALATWVQHPPIPEFASMGEELLGGLLERIAKLFHPGLGAIAGPYVRAHAIDLTASVSFLGLWLQLLGHEQTLPRVLDATTDHVHDLAFRPLLQHLSSPVAERWRARPAGQRREHRQAFDDESAHSVVAPTFTLGVERGRTQTFARHQYVPLVAHWAAGSQVAHVGVFLGPNTQLDAEISGELVSATISALDTEGSPDLSIRLATNLEVSVDDTQLTLGSGLDSRTLQCSVAPDQVGPTEQDRERGRVTLTWTNAAAIRLVGSFAPSR